jgi:hypothetical protein
MKLEQPSKDGFNFLLSHQANAYSEMGVSNQPLDA